MEGLVPEYLVELLRKQSSKCHGLELVPQLVYPQAVRQRAVNQQRIPSELHDHHHVASVIMFIISTITMVMVKFGQYWFWAQGRLEVLHLQLLREYGI